MVLLQIHIWEDGKLLDDTIGNPYFQNQHSSILEKKRNNPKRKRLLVYRVVIFISCSRKFTKIRPTGISLRISLGRRSGKVEDVLRHAIQVWFGLATTKGFLCNHQRGAQ